MHETSLLSVAVLTIALAACSSGPVEPIPSPEPARRTIRVETSDVERYRAAMDEGRRIMRDLGVLPTIRLEIENQAPAGEQSVVRLDIEYPDHATREEWAGRLEQSERYLEWGASLDTIRTVLSDDEN